MPGIWTLDGKQFISAKLKAHHHMPQQQGTACLRKACEIGFNSPDYVDTSAFQPIG